VPWKVHDLRRTMATGMGELGVQPHIIEAAINHQAGHKAGVAGTYNRANYHAERKQALEKMGRACHGAGCQAEERCQRWREAGREGSRSCTCLGAMGPSKKKASGMY
jgi:hypothetical protein